MRRALPLLNPYWMTLGNSLAKKESNGSNLSILQDCESQRKKGSRGNGKVEEKGKFRRNDS